MTKSLQNLIVYVKKQSSQVKITYGSSSQKKK